MEEEDTRNVDDAYEGHMSDLAEQEDIRKHEENTYIAENHL